MAFQIQERLKKVNRALKKKHKEDSKEFKDISFLIKEVSRYRENGNREKAVKILCIIEDKLSK